MPAPKNVKGVRSLLGSYGFYRQFVKDYAEIAAPLVALTKKHAKFHWGPEQEGTFQKLKDLLISPQVMAYLDPTKPYHLYTDASNLAW